jgi:hypothetical protein
MNIPIDSYNFNPIYYPKPPPKTEAVMAISAIKYAFLGFATIIGINRISGGIGKKELSVNATTANAQSA